MTTSDLLKYSQTKFWAVNLGKPAAYDPARETEFLVTGDLADATLDGTLDKVASTYSPESDRIVMGIGRPGPRVLNFAPVIRMDDIPLTALVRELLERCEQELDTEVEIEVKDQPQSNMEIPGMPANVGMIDLSDMLGKAMGRSNLKRRKLKVPG